jgi:hypothetical protein
MGGDGMIEEPIVLLGAPRSGTSLIAMCLASCGAWAGVCRPADRRNPRGYFENMALSEMLKRQAPMDRSEVEQVLADEGYAGGPWFVKHAPQPWRHWLRDFKPRWVAIHRPRNEIVRSMMAADGLDEVQATKLASVHIEHIREFANETRGVATIEARPIIRGDFSALECLCDRLGLSFDRDRVVGLVDPSLWSGPGGRGDAVPVPN